MATPTIRPAERCELDSIRDLVAEAYSTPRTPGGFTNRAEDDIEKMAADMDAGTRILVAEIGDKIVGTNRYQIENGDVCHLTRLAVHPDFRSRGIGTMLVQQALDLARSEGATKARLEVIEERDLAPFYESFGFKSVEVLPHHRHTIIKMERDLN